MMVRTKNSQLIILARHNQNENGANPHDSNCDSLLNILCTATHHTYSTTKRHTDCENASILSASPIIQQKQNMATFKLDSTHRLSPQNLTNKRQQQ